MSKADSLVEPIRSCVTVKLNNSSRKNTKNVLENMDLDQQTLTMDGKMGASQVCDPSVVSLNPSISLSGVLASFCIFSNTLTLSG